MPRAIFCLIACLIYVPHHYYCSEREVLRLGFCGGHHDVRWPAIAALAHKTLKSNDPILPQLSGITYDVHWRIGYANSFDEEVKGGLNAMRPDCNQTDASARQPVHAMVGCTYSSASEEVAAMGRVLETVMVAYISGSPTLSNKERYKYFSRTRGTSEADGGAIAIVCDMFEWYDAGFFYEDYSFFQGAFDGARKKGAELSPTNLDKQVKFVGFALEYVPGGAGSPEGLKKHLPAWRNAFEIARNSGRRVFGIGLSTPNFKVQAAYELGLELEYNKFVLISVQLFPNVYPTFPSDLRQAWNGAMAVDVAQSAGNQYSRALEAQWRQMNFSQLEEYGVPPQFVIDMQEEYPQMFSENPFYMFQAHEFDAIMTILLACQGMLDDCQTSGTSQCHIDVCQGSALNSKVLNMSFESASGNVAFDPESGDRRNQPFNLFQAQDGVLELMGEAGSTSIDKSQFVFPNGQTLPSEFNFKLECGVGLVSDLQFKECRICADGEYADKDNNRCASCPPGRYSAPDKSECLDCDAGFHAETSGMSSCTACLPGRYNPAMGQVACEQCPRGAECPNFGEVAFVSKPGYYVLQPSRLADEFLSNGASGDGFDALGPFKCPLPDACLGNNTCYRLPGETSPAMHGPMCASCLPGYHRGSAHRLCSKCPQLWVSVLLVCLGLIVFMIVIAFSKWMHERHLRSFQISGAVPKVVLYFIVLFECTAANLNMAERFPVGLSIIYGRRGSEYITQPTVSFVSLECMAKQMFPGVARPIYANVLVAWLLIPVGLILCLVIVCIRLKRNATMRERRHAFTSMAVVMMYFLHPVVTNVFTAVFRCKGYDVDTGLFYDLSRFEVSMDIECSDSNHLLWVGIAAAGIAVWSFGIPLFFFWKLRQLALRHRLVVAKSLKTYGFLYNGLKPHCYWFGSLRMFKKVIYLICGALPFTGGAEQRRTLLLTLIILFMSVHLKYEPFDSRHYQLLNFLEHISCITLLLLLLGANIQDAFSTTSITHTIEWFYFPAFVGVILVFVVSAYICLRRYLHQWLSLPQMLVYSRWNFFQAGQRLYCNFSCEGEGYMGSVGMLPDHVALAASDSQKRWFQTVPHHERTVLQTLFAETIDLLLEHHESCLGVSPGIISLPRLLMQIERVLTSSCLVAHKKRIRRRKGLGEEDGVTSLQMRSSVMSSVTSLKLAVKDVQERISGNSPNGGADRKCPWKFQNALYASDDSQMVISAETEPSYSRYEPLCIEEMHTSLALLRPFFLDRDAHEGRNFLRELAGGHRGVLSSLSHSSALFEPDAMFLRNAVLKTKGRAMRNSIVERRRVAYDTLQQLIKIAHDSLSEEDMSAIAIQTYWKRVRGVTDRPAKVSSTAVIQSERTWGRYNLTMSLEEGSMPMMPCNVSPELQAFNEANDVPLDVKIAL